jgi:hypothetical protein
MNQLSFNNLSTVLSRLYLTELLLPPLLVRRSIDQRDLIMRFTTLPFPKLQLISAPNRGRRFHLPVPQYNHLMSVSNNNLLLKQIKDINCRLSLTIYLLAASTSASPHSPPPLLCIFLVCMQPTFFHHADLLANLVIDTDEANSVLFQA